MEIDLQQASGKPVLQAAGSGLLRQRPQDFIVEEIPSFPLAGEGEHLWLKIQKTDANTDWVAGQLARWLGVKRRDVGFAGLKDRHAVTTQWFSVYLPGKPDKTLPELQANIPQPLADAIVLREQTRHTRKLRRGCLKGNRFSITIRQFSGDRGRFASQVQTLAKSGIPNYFGRQRFGHDFDNITRAIRWFRGEIKPGKRLQRSLYLSAARSFLFNRILARRVAEQNWNAAIAGDVFMLDGTQAWFQDGGEADLAERLATFDIHPSGALWGRGGLPTTAQAGALERDTVAAFPVLCAGLEKYGLQQERRALRVRADGLSCTWLDATSPRLDFSLPPGAYATVVIEQLCRVRDSG